MKKIDFQSALDKIGVSTSKTNKKTLEFTNTGQKKPLAPYNFLLKNDSSISKDSEPDQTGKQAIVNHISKPKKLEIVIPESNPVES